MAETAAHLVDYVLPHVSMRQWVLSVPHHLRYRMALKEIFSTRGDRTIFVQADRELLFNDIA
jgi:hypothetical protein